MTTPESTVTTSSVPAAPSSSVHKRANRRERRAWYLYDFGNSAYAAVVLLAVYSTYFKDKVVGGDRGSWLWGLSIGIAMLVVAVGSPILGAIADFGAKKKRFLFVATGLSCLFTALLFFTQQGTVFIGMLFFILAEIGYRGAQVFYDGLLPELGEPDELASISGIGWAIGSAGGIACLLIILPLIMFVKGPMTVRWTFVITALFYALAALPLFMYLRERAKPQILPPGETYFTVGFKRLWRTMHETRHYHELWKFMVAFLVYNDGIIMALDFAAIMGMVLFGVTPEQLIILMVILQATSVAGAYLFGIMAHRIGSKRTLVISLLMMLGCVTALFFNQTLAGFFVIAALAGFALTGVQSVSRTLVATFSPEGRAAEFFGFFSVAGRTSSFIGPTVYGYVASRAARAYVAAGREALAAEQAGQRVAIVSIAVFLLVGLVLLLRVNEQQGRAAALTAPERMTA